MRKTKVVTIDDDNSRDKGRSYFLMEMSAFQSEKWAIKAVLALGRAGIDVGDDVVAGGAAAVMIAGLSSFVRLKFEDAEPLLDEMMECVSFVPDLNAKDVLTGYPVRRALITHGDGPDIEELTTLLKLRAELLDLHTGFSLAAALQTLGSAAKQALSQSGTKTSRPRSARSSRKSSRRSTSSKRSTA